MKKFVSLLLALSFLLSLSITAFATEESIPSSNVENLEYAIEYITDTSTITERIIFSEEGFPPVVLERIVHPSGQMLVYLDGNLISTVSGADYDLFLYAAEDPAAYNELILSQITPADTTLPCGFDEVHVQVGESQTFTYNIPLTLGIADIVDWISEKFGPIPEYTVDFIIELMERAIDREAGYVDITETQFLIFPEGYDEAQLCHHDLYAFYNRSPEGEKEYLFNEWHFYLTPMSDYP